MITFRYLEWGWFALAVLAALAVVAWYYRRGPVGLLVLRAGLVTGLLVLVMQPVLPRTVATKVQPTVAVLFDESASMTIPDERVAQVERSRPVLARLDGPRHVFGRDQSDTALGDALRELLTDPALAGIVVVTDGANNAGSSPVAAAAIARQVGRPLYLYGVGNPTPRDIVISDVVAEDVAFVNEAVPVVVRLRAPGFAGERARVQVRLGDTVSAVADIELTGAAEQAVTVALTPDTAGELDLTASIASLPGEVVPVNNTWTKRLRVVDTKIKVLLVEQAPRWEYRYLQALLERDRRVDLTVVLGDAPTWPAELAGFDLIILGAVDSQWVPAERLRDYAAQAGGALVVVAGQRPLELGAVSPVEVAGLPVLGPGRLDLTAAGAANPVLQLAETPTLSRQVWAELPAVDWVARVQRVRPAAEVWLTATPEKLPVLVWQPYGLGQTLFMGTDTTWRWRREVGDRYFARFWGQIVLRLAAARLPKLAAGPAPQREFAEPAMNAALLQEMATLSGGEFLREADLARLPELIGRYAATVRTTQNVEVWASPVVLILLLVVAGWEWWLRKRRGLK